MARYELGVLTSAAAATNAYADLRTGASNQVRLLEVGVANTTSTACDASLARHTTLGTATSPVSGEKQEGTDVTSTAQVGTAWSVQPLATNYLRRGKLGGAIGSGFIWSWAFPGLLIPVSAGIGVYNQVGTGQILAIYWVWDELQTNYTCVYGDKPGRQVRHADCYRGAYRPDNPVPL